MCIRCLRDGDTSRHSSSRKGEKHDWTPLSTRFSPDLLEDLRSIGQADGVVVSDLIRTAVEEYVARRQDSQAVLDDLL